MLSNDGMGGTILTTLIVQMVTNHNLSAHLSGLSERKIKRPQRLLRAKCSEIDDPIDNRTLTQ